MIPSLNTIDAVVVVCESNSFGHRYSVGTTVVAESLTISEFHNKARSILTHLTIYTGHKASCHTQQF